MTTQSSANRVRRPYCRPQLRNQATCEAICQNLWDLIGSCRRLSDAHGEDCDCDFCPDARWLLKTARIAEAMFTSQMLPFPALEERCGLGTRAGSHADAMAESFGAQ